MTLLIIGLALFLGAHSIKIVASGPRDALIARLGAGPWRGIYSLLSLGGLVLIVIGYGQARWAAPIWPPVPGAAHFAIPLALLSFVLLACAHGPANHVRALVKDPMVLGVAAWAGGHLWVRSTPAALALFGAFGAWAILDFISMRLRPRPEPGPAPKLGVTVGMIVSGLVVGVLFAVFAHPALFGVSPFGG